MVRRDDATIFPYMALEVFHGWIRSTSYSLTNVLKAMTDMSSDSDVVRAGPVEVQLVLSCKSYSSSDDGLGSVRSESNPERWCTHEAV